MSKPTWLNTAGYSATSAFLVGAAPLQTAEEKRTMSTATATTLSAAQLEQLSVDTIRFLSVDAVQKANSGHPGLPLGAAPMAYVLWTRFLQHNPANPQWFNRDRFVLSAGHGSMLLYSLLHLTGYDLPLEQIKQFRQWGSITPGHPERGLTPGIVNHFTYGLVSDGDLMEGVASEATSLAGQLELGKLIYLFDSNHVTLSAGTNITSNEDYAQRFEAYGWHTQSLEDGNDLDAIDDALRVARSETGRPSLIFVHTHLGYGSPNKQDTFEAHGSPLGVEEVKLTKQNLGWPVEPLFDIPPQALAHFRKALARGQHAEAQWQDRFSDYARNHPHLAREFQQRMRGELPAGWDADIPVFPADPKGMKTHAASGQVMSAIASKLPSLIGGSADLDPSTHTALKDEGDFESPDRASGDTQGSSGGGWNYAGRNLHFGVREHGMGAILNGLAVHGGFIPYGATFFIFSDYMRPPIRLAAMMEQRVIYVFTHDSLGVGEDGATHQPVEQLANLRAIPHLIVIRPCDANETACAWRVAIETRDGPVALILTRQDVPTLDGNRYASAEGLKRGAYILAEAASGRPEVILVATGSEVNLIVEARQQLQKQDIQTRLVSMPSWELFDTHTEEYRRSIFPPSVRPRLAVEAGATQGWHRYIGQWGDVVGLDHFGASAPGPVLMREFGFTAENVCKRAIALLEKTNA